MLNDVRHALRLLSRSPTFTLTGVITLAVGIGATTSVYSIYNAVLLRPLAFDDPERVVAVRIRQVRGGENGISGGTIAAVRSLPAVDRAAVHIRTEQTLLDRGDPQVVRGALVTGEFFALFGVSAAAGRVLDVHDSKGDGSPLVLSYRIWQQRFGGDEAMIGRAIRLGSAVHT